MIGYLLPRHSMDESDLKRWILAHQRAHGRPHAAAAAAAAAAADVGDSRAADEYNNLLDLLKIAGLVASLVGCLVIVTTLMVPACSSGLAADSANSVWSDKDEVSPLFPSSSRFFAIAQSRFRIPSCCHCLFSFGSHDDPIHLRNSQPFCLELTITVTMNE